MPRNDLSQCSDPTFLGWMLDGMAWTHGVGFLPLTGKPVYDDAYWEKYQGYALTDMGAALTADRVAIARHYCGETVDIGIGSGQFVEQFGCKGYDINPKAIDWLQARQAWHDPYLRPIESATFWDSLEHIASVDRILANINRSVVMALPIFVDKAHALKSKHFRPDEHCWYLTHQGLIDWMKAKGFRLREHSNTEQRLGREDVWTYAFTR